MTRGPSSAELPAAEPMPFRRPPAVVDDAAVVDRAAPVVVALVASIAQAYLDLTARRVEISAVPATIALHLGGLVAALLAVALVARRRSGAAPGAGSPTWRLGLSLAAEVVLLTGRALVDPIAPTVAWLAPLLVVTPALLSVELASLRRLGLRPNAALAVASAWWWTAFAAVALSAIAIGPSRWHDLDVRADEVRLVGWSTAAVAAVACLMAGLGRRRSQALRLAVVVLTAVAVAGTDPPLSGTAWQVLGCAAVMALASLSTDERVRRLSRALGDTWSRVAAATRSAAGVARRRSAALVATGRGCRAGQRRAIAPREPSSRPVVRRSDRVAGATMAVGSFLFVASGVIWAFRVGWQPSGHAATLMVRAQDVGTVHHPLLGIVTSLGSEGGASHPGPLVMDLLAPFVRLFGMRTGALVAGGLTAFVTWLVVVWAAWRAAGRAAAVIAWVGGALVLEVAALGAVWEANNVSITMLAMFAVLMASWAAATGTWSAWWWAVGLASLSAQGYLPHGLIVLLPVVWSGLAMWGAARTSSDAAERTRIRRAIRVGLLIALVAWAQPLLEVVIHRGGNLEALARQAADPQPVVGPSGFVDAVAWIFTLPPRWEEITGSFAISGAATDFIGGALWPGLLAVVAVGVLWRLTRSTRSDAERQLRVLTVLVVVAAGVNATQLPQQALRSFQLGWLVLVSIFVWSSVATTIVAVAQRRVGAGAGARWRPALRVGGLAVAALVVLEAGWARPDSIEEIKGAAFTIDEMVPGLVDQTMGSLDTDGQVLVLGLDTRLNQINMDTILSNLIVDGLDARVETGIGLHYGPRRLVDDDWSGPMLWVTSGLPPREPDGELLASASMSTWSRDGFDELSDRVAGAVVADPGATLEPWVLPALPRYLAGWVDDPCRAAADLADGRVALSSLPPALLLTLYGDLALDVPTLPHEVREQASGVVGQAPVEVWLIDRKPPGPIHTDLLLRDGTMCSSPDEGP